MENKAQETSEHEDMTPARRRELLDELKSAVARAQHGDEEALSQVGQLLMEFPLLAQSIVDLARTVERSYIKTISRIGPLVQEALPSQLNAMTEELAGPEPSPLERLLAERIVACRLQLQCADLVYSQNLGEMSMAQSEYHQRRLDRLHRRYLSSIKTLAQIRKLGPVVQINIAEKQINTAG